MTDSRSNSRHTREDLSTPVKWRQTASEPDSQGIILYQVEPVTDADSDELTTNSAHIRHTESTDSTHGNPFAEIYAYVNRLLEDSTISGWMYEDATDEEWKIRNEERARIFGDIAADIDELVSNLVQRLQ